MLHKFTALILLCLSGHLCYSQEDAIIISSSQNMEQKTGQNHLLYQIDSITNYIDTVEFATYKDSMTESIVSINAVVKTNIFASIDSGKLVRYVKCNNLYKNRKQCRNHF